MKTSSVPTSFRFCASASLLVLALPGIAISQDSHSYQTALILPEPIPFHSKVSFSPTFLPAGAKGVWPAFDGDAFYVVFPPQNNANVDKAEVIQKYINPVLRAIGHGELDGNRFEMNIPVLALPAANLSQLADITCQEHIDQEHGRFVPVCHAMQTGKADAVAERVFDIAYGMTFDQFKSEVERKSFQYVFRQTVDKVPIEQAAVIASHKEGESTSLVHGTLFRRFKITNSFKLSEKKAIDTGLSHLLKFEGLFPAAKNRQQSKQVTHVLLPFGTVKLDASEVVAGLKHAYRAILYARFAKEKGATAEPVSWMAWIDASTGEILKLIPQFSGADSSASNVTARGATWPRDPRELQLNRFPVDGEEADSFVLKFNQGVVPAFERVDRGGDRAFNSCEPGQEVDCEVALTVGEGADSANANFNQVPINNGACAVCKEVNSDLALQCEAGPNDLFRQVNTFAHLSLFRRLVIAAGSFPSLPEYELLVWIDHNDPDLPNSIDTAGSNYDGRDENDRGRLRFGIGPGFLHPNCPEQPDLILNLAQDASILAHELAHISVQRLQDRRPGGLPITPTARIFFHDFADAFANAYASTPCVGGWVAKNVGGANESLDCKGNTSEISDLPRLAETIEPFDGVSGDHFPEHRDSTDNLAKSFYADGQIAAAALWRTRAGMRSKCLPSGTAQFWVRLNRGLWNFGSVVDACPPCAVTGCAICDRDIYRNMYDLLFHLTWQWALSGHPMGPPAFRHNGAHTTNKLLSAWAANGMFLVPISCLDEDPSTNDPSYCQEGSFAGDAVIDVDDNDVDDDVLIRNITHVETDYIERMGETPTFRVWTGPRYRFSSEGSARPVTPNDPDTPALCNENFLIELSNDKTFRTGVIRSSAMGDPWLSVSRTVVPECYGTWTPSASQWNELSGASGDVRVYYRVHTQDGAGLNERISTSPLNGVFSVPPSYLIVNDTGRP